MDVRLSIQQLLDEAVNRIGFCVGVHWRSVTGSRVPVGMISARCRLGYILFSGYTPAQRFHRWLTTYGVERLPSSNIRLVQVEHQGKVIVGVAVVAVLSPDSRQPTGYRAAPAFAVQPGYQRYFRDLAARTQPVSAWWDDPDDAYLERDDREREALPDFAQRTADETLEADLDRLEREYSDKLWWYGLTPGRRSKYPPALKDVQELFAYARRPDLDVETIAQRNAERAANRWLAEQQQREREQYEALAADQAEIAAALNTPRRGRACAADGAWNATLAALRQRRALRFVYRDAQR